jgi:hypothetical protein
MSDEREKTRSELLNELESIQGLLDNDDIPVLQEVIEQLEQRHNNMLGRHEENYELDLGGTINTQATAAPTPGPHSTAQPTNSSAKNLTPAQHSPSNSENPFLPQHIRSRLRGNRAGDFTTEPNNRKNAERQRLIDEVIGDLMPQLKATLRTKLSTLTDAQLHALNSQDD